MSDEQKNLTLYGIETQLLELLEFREDLLADPTLLGAEREESLKVTEDRIREYFAREVVKVDGIAAYMRECKTRMEALEAEAKRIQAKADAWEKRRKHIESNILAVMVMAGRTRIEGKTSTLKTAKCPASVEVLQPDLVPPEYQRVKITLSLALWNRIRAALMNEKQETLAAELLAVIIAAQAGPEPMKEAIRDELKRNVGVAGCRLVTDKVRLVVE